jgi:hypothetical protein
MASQAVQPEAQVGASGLMTLAELGSPDQDSHKLSQAHGPSHWQQDSDATPGWEQALEPEDSEDDERVDAVAARLSVSRAAIFPVSSPALYIAVAARLAQLRGRSDVLNLYVKNDRDEMVPYAAFMTMKERQGPNEITRYNLYNSSAIRGGPAKGYTNGDAIQAVREVAAQALPRGYDIAWDGLSFDGAARGNEAFYIFLVVLAFVYLVLAAHYESFILPFAVVLSLPAVIFGSFLLLKLLGLANDIYAQVGARHARGSVR